MSESAAAGPESWLWIYECPDCGFVSGMELSATSGHFVPNRGAQTCAGRLIAIRVWREGAVRPVVEALAACVDGGASFGAHKGRVVSDLCHTAFSSFPAPEDWTTDV